MNTNAKAIDNFPPRLFPTLIKGFNLVASRIYLILIPFVLDLALWLGPKLRIRELFLPLLNNFTATILKISPKDLVETVKASDTLWNAMLEQFNLFTTIRTIPIGVPSLIARYSSMKSPLAENWVLETPSLQAGIAIFGGLLVLGYFLGSVYFNQLSRFSASEPEKFDSRHLFSQFVQSGLLFVILVVVAALIAIPILILLSIFSLISAGLGQFFLMAVILMGMWLLVPLAFTPHAIFALDQRAFPSMLLSMRMVRFFLPGTGLFVVFSALISEGLNILWTLPEPDSWLSIVGIGGHAFIVTGLLAASFIYFREGLGWMKFNIQKMNEARTDQNGGGVSIE